MAIHEGSAKLIHDEEKILCLAIIILVEIVTITAQLEVKRIKKS